MLDYSVVILDEAHERSLQTDILMGLLKQLQQNGTHLKVVVMSATLDVELFQQFFLQTNVVSIPGRQYPVQVLYTKHEETDIIEAMMLTCMQIHVDAKDYGAVLAFLPGQEDIEALQGMLEEQLSHCSSRLVSKVESLTGASARQTTTNVEKDFLICPLYANMPSDEQLRVFQAVPSHVRKFILATNIAETSITVPDIRYIVDSGFVKTKLMHPVTGMEMLKTVSISKAQANQRTGRAGRTSAGVCYRVYQEQVYERMDDVSLPEIQRVNLLQVILQLKEIGIEHILQFPLPSPPSRTGLKQAFHMLLLLRAIDEVRVTSSSSLSLVV